MSSHRLSRHGLLWLFGGVVLAGFVILSASETPAQGKKDKGKPDTKETKEPKEAKVAPPPTTFPKRVDTIDPSQGGVSHVTMIDEKILEGWKNNKSYPSERCTDYEFIRRASLDIIGRIPKVEEVFKFMKQPSEKRRSWLINEMLDGATYGNGHEYAENFANLWTILLMTRTGSNDHARDCMHEFLYNGFKGDEKASKPVLPDWSKMAKALVAAKGLTNGGGDENAVNYLLHNLGEELRADAAKGKGGLDTTKNGRWDMIPATSRTTRLFLGVRTQCVQCHDHPFNGEWKQENFWGINAFFRQVETPRGKPTMMLVKKKDKKIKSTQDYELKDEPSYNVGGMVMYERRNTVYLATNPTFLDGRKIPKDFKGTRREALAGFVVTSPYFAKSFVNRTWGHFFGKSFTKDAVDDFGDSNPASHPELLDKLAEDWATNYGHNPKVLVRWICNSQAYGLSSKANKWNDKQDDETLFARVLLKPMTPEQMYESIMIATEDPRYKNKLDKKAREDKEDEKNKFLNKLTISFGNDEGEEGSFSGTVVQALMLMNGQDINNAISDPKTGAVKGIVDKHGASPAKIRLVLNDIFMLVLSRTPTEAEYARFTSPLVFNFRPGTKTTPNTPQFWTNYYQDVMWALLNSNEFILNH